MIDRRTRAYRRSMRVIKEWLTVLSVIIALTGVYAYLIYPPAVPISPLGDPTHVIAADATPTPTPTPLPSPKTAPTVSQIVDGIHLLESSRGKAKIGLQAICEAQGLSNEYGYGGMDLKICFRNHVEAKARVTLWVVEHMEKYHGNVGQTLCRYANGGSATDCEYYQNFLRRVK